MKKKNIFSIRLSHIKNVIGLEKEVFEKKLKTLDRKKYFGFIEERTYTTPKGKIIIETELVQGTPTQCWRNRMKKAGLLGVDLFKGDKK